MCKDHKIVYAELKSPQTSLIFQGIAEGIFHCRTRQNQLLLRVAH